MIPALVMLILQILDCWTTKRVLDQGGTEENPIMAWAFDRLGFWPSCAGKCLIGPLAVYWCAGFNAQAAWLMCGLYVLMVGWNVRQMTP